MGAKNNDSHLKKQAIVIFYTMEYRKCGNFNSKNDTRPCMGASAFLKSIDFRAFAVNVKTIAPKKYLYQFGHAIWWDEAPAMIATFLADNDFSGKRVIPFCTSASDDIGNSLHIFSELCPGAEIAEGLTANDPNDIEPWLQELGLMK